MDFLQAKNPGAPHGRPPKRNVEHAGGDTQCKRIKLTKVGKNTKGLVAKIFKFRNLLIFPEFSLNFLLNDV